MEPAASFGPWCLRKPDARAKRGSAQPDRPAAVSISDDVEPMRPQVVRSRSRLLLAGGVFVWCLMLGAGFGMLQTYAHSPGVAAATPEFIAPADLDAWAGSGDGHVAIIVVHPLCPCTPASIDELEIVTEGMRVALVAAGPGARTETALEPLRARAQRAGWSFVCDAEGSIASRLGARTSGHTLVYDTTGTLAFSGGVTASRGHRGPNAGAGAIASLGAGSLPVTRVAPVYGCPLFDDPDAPLSCTNMCGHSNMNSKGSS